MVHVESDQCGMCAHFGEQHPGDSEIVEIRNTHEAPEGYVDDCGHPKHAPLNLQVTPNSHCDGFKPVSG